MSDDGTSPGTEDRGRSRMVSGCGALVLVIAVVLLITADDRRSVASSVMLALLGAGLLLTVAGKARPRLRRVAAATFLLAIVLAVYGLVLPES